MSLASLLASAGLAVASQYGTVTAVVSAGYTGGDSSRPQLGKSGCTDSSLTDTTVRVTYNFSITSTGVTTTIPVGVLYTQDADIPASTSTTTTSSSAFTGTLTGSSPVACSEPASDSILVDNITLTGISGTVNLTDYKSITVGELFHAECSAGTALRKRRAICFGIRNGANGTTVARGGDGPDIDTVAPGAPTGISARAGDSKIVVSLDAPSGVTGTELTNLKYIVEYRACTEALAGATAFAPDAGSTDGGTSGSSAEDLGSCGVFITTGQQASPVDVTGLDNDVSYQVRARAVDEFGNEGPVGDSAFATPVKEYGFLDLYDGEVYGASCTQAGGLAPWGMLGLAVAWLAWRRRQRSR